MVQIRPICERAERVTKSHQRKLVDCSDPVYKGALAESENPTNGSWWMVKIQPPKQSEPNESKAI
jgi:hypothetical protein